MQKAKGERKGALCLDHALRSTGVVPRHQDDPWAGDAEAEMEDDARAASSAAFEAHIKGKLKLPSST
jgi:hypothetical protein